MARPTRTPFSIRETVLAPGDARDRFERCFVEARKFLERTTISNLLEAIFAHGANRRAVGAVVRAPLHVGFIFPGGGELSIAQMSEACRQAGFSADDSTIPSTVIARELGVLADCVQVPTMIFSAAINHATARPGYVEAFIPAADRGVVRQWVEEEIGSHVGLMLADHSAFRVTHEAFLAEGFTVPPFMCGQAITNPDAGVSVIYYERPRAAGTTRIEVLSTRAGMP
jgi:hypothetical protein